MKTILSLIVALLVIPAYAQEVSPGGDWVKPEIQQDWVKPEAPTGGSVTKVSPPSKVAKAAEKTKDAVVNGYNVAKQKWEEKTQEAEPTWWEKFTGVGRPKPIFPQNNITATAFALVVMLILTYFVKGFAATIAKVTPWKEDDRPFVFVVMFLYGLVCAHLLRGVILGIPGVGWLFRELGVWGHLACWTVILIVQWKLGSYHFEKSKKEEKKGN